MEHNLCLIFLDAGMTFKIILEIIGGLIICIPIIIFTFILFCYFYMADKNKFFSFGRENRVMYIMDGSEDGSFSGKMILPSHTTYIDSTNKFLPLPEDEDARKDLMPKKVFGMFWIGIYPFKQLHYRHQVWGEWKVEEVIEGGVKKSKLKLDIRDEKTPFLIVKPFAYALMLTATENVEAMPLDFGFTAFLMPVHATLPVFANEDAFGQAQNIILGSAALFVKAYKFKELGVRITADTAATIGAAAKEHDAFSEFLCLLNDEIPGRTDGKGLRTLLGYEIQGAKINMVEITGENKTLIADATTKEYVAEQNKKVTVLNSEAEKIAMDNITAAKLKRMEFYEAIKNNPAAQQIENSKEMFGKDSKLSTLVIGDKASSSILLPPSNN